MYSYDISTLSKDKLEETNLFFAHNLQIKLNKNRNRILRRWGIWKRMPKQFLKQCPTANVPERMGSRLNSTSFCRYLKTYYCFATLSHSELVSGPFDKGAVLFLLFQKIYNSLLLKNTGVQSHFWTLIINLLQNELPLVLNKYYRL